jgi:hypothetical protein
MYKEILSLAKKERSTRENVLKTQLTRDEIAEVAEKNCNIFREQLGDNFEEVLNAMKTELINDGMRTIGTNALIDEGYKPWLSNKMPNIDPKFWDKYVNFLSEEYSPVVINSTDDDTHEILDRLADPDSNTFNKRGLVLGSVQMGKTLNYIGLIAKAADAGYRFIIVVAGATEVLRGQTQRRVDEGFIDQPSSVSGKTQTESQGELPISLTDASHDFNKMKRDTNFNIKQTNVPVIVVIKKNSKVLNNLLEWIVNSLALRSTDKTTGEVVRPNNEDKTDIPMLFLDDEADYASVNTNEDGEDPTAINKVIRNILKRFSKRSYVAYTATPFANIFINPATVEDAINDKDLFPENFIYRLGFPSNYMGPNSFFGDDASKNTVTILSSKANERISDFFIIDKENEIVDVIGLSSELKHAIRYFILLVVERKLRGHIEIHNSMMVNAQYRIAIQNGLKRHIKEYLDSLIKSCMANFGLPEHKAINDKHIKSIENTFKREFISKDIKHEDSHREFKDMLKHLNLASSIDVLAIHGEAKTKDHLDYENYPEGRNLIAIGGFSLSRGLTLQGLSVSFLDRTTKMSDTLLQMGRWFGFRDGYEDLCRLYIDRQSHEFYCEINNTINELYRELEFMRSYNLTPKDFGLKVREVPGALEITAKNKMRRATIGTSSWDFWGTKYQSVNLYSDIETNNLNLNVTKNLITNLTNHDADFSKNGRLWRNVDADQVIDFLKAYKEPSRKYGLGSMVRKFIEEIKTIHPSWNVWFYSNNTTSKKAQRLRKADGVDAPFEPIEIIKDNFSVNQSLRKVTGGPTEDKIITISNAQISGGDIEQHVLSSGEHEKFISSLSKAKDLEMDDQSSKVIINSHVRAALLAPTLILNPLITYHEDLGPADQDDIDKEKYHFLSNPDVDVCIGFSISFPSLMPNGSIPTGNKQQWAYTELAKEQDKDKEDIEQIDEEYYAEY